MNARRVIALMVVAATALLLAGCFDPFSPRVLGRGLSTPPPTPNSPSGLLRLFEWAYNNRDYSEYRTVFTDDYRFVFSALDTAGNRYRDQPFTRADELESAKALFDAASTISLQLDKSFTIFPDPRAGKNPTYHKNIRTQVLLNITTLDGNQTNVQGKANFFVVRGDSAAIPSDLGFAPDSNRWYIERWEDETLAGSLLSSSLARLSPGGTLVLPPGPGIRSAGALPASRAAMRPSGAERGSAKAWEWLSWGQVKVLYH